MINDSSNYLARLAYDKGLKQAIKKHYKDKYEKRIDYLVGFNNQLMAELEQWERVGERLEKATDDSLSPEESHWKRDML
jgi:hypothetical protein|tara:strand:+ start:245 stop:481 length:237 start_codon:yes stop_codon:yes gene_type:complete